MTEKTALYRHYAADKYRDLAAQGYSQATTAKMLGTPQ